MYRTFGNKEYIEGIYIWKYFTDNNSYAIKGQLVNTPPLQGIAGTGPYLSDGSAPTLRSVLEWARSGEMGNTSSLTDAEMDDLEAYLSTL